VFAPVRDSLLEVFKKKDIPLNEKNNDDTIDPYKEPVG